MKGTYLGEFEELVLLTVGALYPEAYGVGIMDDIAKETGRSVNISAIHSALRRLDEKGFVTSEMGGPTNERGGRRKRIFELTAFGKKALDEVQEQRMSLYNRIPNISFGS
ncbi:PadR family transcriptional regulator [Roseivirga echinicomitans]|uniref:PadR family transcriptional regulator n=1 Tax=Roseivirga echinicomitans TaxID=296218 RepID=A0A150X274_9BACT|nr:PadR family transcriptional regulator [Roseivirga echinicomitans]KYG72818.1 PadR family transcriptional regulator [Roseivirga echinicomitans]|tara:strand:- start:4573 stop:4902 length:330 start_codon:yes stop_codon:yes gene_type:complete